MKKRIASFVAGAVATASIPPSIGVMDWKVIAGAAVLGGVGGLFGVNVAGKARQYLRKPARQ